LAKKKEEKIKQQNREEAKTKREKEKLAKKEHPHGNIKYLLSLKKIRKTIRR
jgi:hypothetical protein